MVLYVAAAEAPSWTDKLEAWSTFGGAVFTAGAVIVAFLVWRHDQRLRREDKREADASQARLVYTTVPDILGGPEDGYVGIATTINNNSAAPITQVSVSADVRLQGSEVFDETKLLPGLAAHTSEPIEFRFSEPLPWPSETDFEAQADLVLGARASVYFTDSAGRHWNRDGYREPTTGPAVERPSLAWYIGEYVGINPRIRAVRDFCATKYRYSFDWFEDRLTEQYRKKKRKRAMKASQRTSNPGPTADTSNQEAAASE